MRDWRPQTQTLSLRWVLMCLFNISILVNCFLHSSHSKGLVASLSISSSSSWTSIRPNLLSSKENVCPSSVLPPTVPSDPAEVSLLVTSMTLSTTPDTLVSRIRGVFVVSPTLRLKDSPVSWPYISVPSSPRVTEQVTARLVWCDQV